MIRSVCNILRFYSAAEFCEICEWFFVKSGLRISVFRVFWKVHQLLCIIITCTSCWNLSVVFLSMGLQLKITVFTARCTLVQSAVLRSHVVCLSVRLSVCL